MEETIGCNVVAIDTPDGRIVNPPPDTTLPLGARMIVIGGTETEELFLQRFANR